MPPLPPRRGRRGGSRARPSLQDSDDDGLDDNDHRMGAALGLASLAGAGDDDDDFGWGGGDSDPDSSGLEDDPQDDDEGMDGGANVHSPGAFCVATSFRVVPVCASVLPRLLWPRPSHPSHRVNMSWVGWGPFLNIEVCGLSAREYIFVSMSCACNPPSVPVPCRLTTPPANLLLPWLQTLRGLRSGSKATLRERARLLWPTLVRVQALEQRHLQRMLRSPNCPTGRALGTTLPTGRRRGQHTARTQCMTSTVRRTRLMDMSPLSLECPVVHPGQR